MQNYYLEDIALDEALRRLFSTLGDRTLPTEEIPLSEAHGRVTAVPVWARLSSPHYHAAAMDGYAVRAVDTLNATETRPITLRLTEQAWPVNTGDSLPPQANAIVMIEQVQQPDDQHISITAAVVPWQHVRMSGEDMVATELVLPANHLLRPVDLGAIAGCGHYMVRVYQRPRVVILPTGSELIPPDREPQPGQIIEYNSLVLAAQVREVGGAPHILPITPDDDTQLRAAVESALALHPELLLLLSGSSAGSKDFTSRIVNKLGQLFVHGVAVRPGHPVIIGAIGDVPVVGVPGYPVSAALTGEIFVQPLLAKMLGLPAPMGSRPRIAAIMTRKLASPLGDDDFVRVTVAQVGERVLATPLSRGAGVITSLVRADGLAHIPRFSEGIEAGAPVSVILYRDEQTVRRSILTVGSHDPMLDLLAQHLGDVPFTSAHVGSLGGLLAIRRGEAHMAGSHLLDEETGEYNISYLAKYVPDTPLVMITFAHREQGLIVPKGNPLGIASLDDLRRVRYVNRQRGSGTRVLLDYELKRRGISGDNITGYTHEEYTHMGVAVAVSTGIADCGLAVRSAANALGLDFISVGWERYDFVIPLATLPHVQPVVDLLNRQSFRDTLAAQPGYRTTETGHVQLEKKG